MEAARRFKCVRVAICAKEGPLPTLAQGLVQLVPIVQMEKGVFCAQLGAIARTQATRARSPVLLASSVLRAQP